MTAYEVGLTVLIPLSFIIITLIHKNKRGYFAYEEMPKL